MNWLNPFRIPHRRATRLIDDRLDAERGEEPLSKEDAAWLDGHLASCTECKGLERQRRMLLGHLSSLAGAEAPRGFAGRVLMAAKARPFEPDVEADDRPRPVVWLGVAAAALATFAVVVIANVGSPGPAPGVQIAGPSGIAASGEPHFTVRAPGIGAAKARAQAVEIIESHGGTYVVAPNAIRARVPRARLVAVMKDLARKSRYKVSQAVPGELEPSLDEVDIVFELE
jgi:hypothetical protein